MDAEVGVGPGPRPGLPAVVVAEDQHRPVGVGPHLVQPFQLLGVEAPAGQTGHDGVDDGQDHARQCHLWGPARGKRRVVVAPDPPQPFTERPLVPGQKGGHLLGPAGVGEIALGDDRVGRKGGHLGDRPSVHDLGIGIVTGPRRQHRAQVDTGDVEAAAFGLTEMEVVDGGDGRQAFPRWAGQGAELNALVAVRRIGVEGVQRDGPGPVEENGRVVGDGRQLEGHLFPTPAVIEARDVPVGRGPGGPTSGPRTATGSVPRPGVAPREPDGARGPRPRP